MLGFAWSEIALVAVVALLVIDPKDLPQILRSLGKGLAILKNFSGEAQKHLRDIANDLGVDELKKEYHTHTNIIKTEIIDLEGKTQIAYDVSVLDTLMTPKPKHKAEPEVQPAPAPKI